VHAAVGPYAVAPWPHLAAGQCSPDLTLAMELTAEKVATAIPLVLEHLRVSGWLDRGGIEDGTTGENWPISDIEKT
jgi:hypothetical protein